MRKGIAFIVSGPSGGGKTTLAKSMLHELDNLRFSVSCTTRKPREGEVDGKDYKFITNEEFENMVQQERFIEHAFVHGNYYGTPVEEFEDAKASGVDLLLDIDVQGASQIKQSYPEAIFCFVMPPTFEILKDRLSRRNGNGDIDIDQRLVRAKEEMAPSVLEQYDFIIINDQLDEALETIHSIIISTRCQSERVLEKIKENL
ncbi:MAG: guanylate kinase [Thermodesulfobacteriota bacterium]|nr:MAG: guanylate kinase [Thermodesulfobacteriota bacterium]